MALGEKLIPPLPRAMTGRDVPEIMRWLSNLRQYLNARASSKTVATLQFEILNEEPKKPRTGMLAAGWPSVSGGFVLVMYLT